MCTVNKCTSERTMCVTMLTMDAEREKRKKTPEKNLFVRRMHLWHVLLTHCVLVFGWILVNLGTKKKKIRKSYAPTRWLICLCQHLQRRDIFSVCRSHAARQQCDWIEAKCERIKSRCCCCSVEVVHARSFRAGAPRIHTWIRFNSYAVRM